VDFSQLTAKLGRTGLVQAGGGLLAFLLSFFAWVSADISEEEKKFLRLAGVSSDISHNAWQEGAGIGAWFPVLLLFGLGVVAVLVALETIKKLPTALLGVGLGGLATLIILLRWLTYGDGLTAGWALYITLVVSIAVTAVSYLGLAAEGSSLSDIPGAFNKAPAQPQPPQQFPPQG